MLKKDQLVLISVREAINKILDFSDPFSEADQFYYDEKSLISLFYLTPALSKLKREKLETPRQSPWGFLNSALFRFVINGIFAYICKDQLDIKYYF